MREKFGSYDKLLKNLIAEVRREEPGAFEELLKIYEPLILSFVGRFCRDDETKAYEDDVRQELTVAFYNCILSYDLSQDDVSFGLYAKICLNNALITQLRSLKKQKGLKTVSLDAILDSREDEKPPQRKKSALPTEEDFDLSVRVVKREELRELNKRIEEVLSPFENDVWRLYVIGCSAKEIAQKLGGNEKSIENAVFRIRKKLKHIFLKK